MGIATLVLQSAANQNRSIASGNGSLILCALARNDVVIWWLGAFFNSAININFRPALFRNRNGHHDFVLRFPSFGYGGNAGKLDFCQRLIQIVQKCTKIYPLRRFSPPLQ